MVPYGLPNDVAISSTSRLLKLQGLAKWRSGPTSSPEASTTGGPGDSDLQAQNSQHTIEEDS